MGPINHETPNAEKGLPCAGCNALNPRGARFCSTCGYALTARLAEPPPAIASACPKCHALALATTMFCQQCGFKIPRAAAAQRVQEPLGARAGAAAWGRIVLVHRDGSDGDVTMLAADVVTIGRVDADLRFADDKFLAPQHARLERRREGVFLLPLDAVNGVYRRVQGVERLLPGAMLLLGREVMRFEEVDGDLLQAPALVQQVLLFGSPPRRPWGRLQQVTMAGPVGDVRYLHGAEVVIGREEGAIVFPDDPFMSRRHAMLRPWERGGELVDLGSSNGSYVRIQSPWLIPAVAHLRLGDQLLRVELLA
ncbi:MAG: FHA domain-containing protein [Myxococcales bacterium]|nr:FHA domain-containing protein [Myxococcales bacterium]